MGKVLNSLCMSRVLEVEPVSYMTLYKRDGCPLHFDRLSSPILATQDQIQKLLSIQHKHRRFPVHIFVLRCLSNRTVSDQVVFEKVDKKVQDPFRPPGLVIASLPSHIRSNLNTKPPMQQSTIPKKTATKQNSLPTVCAFFVRDLLHRQIRMLSFSPLNSLWCKSPSRQAFVHWRNAQGLANALSLKLYRL